ncbi:sensor histidine kinase [Acinetobacter pragensis]|uniref:sensor histidine kinase n=1 Tax=Acinetobacter pragensis TaxID=1806892 RepID=UPI0009D7037B|nr:ATP-binding protein [Acinetobacter pragensis]
MFRWKYLCCILLSCLISSFCSASISYQINSQCQVILNSISKVQTASNLELPKQGWVPVQKLPDNWNEAWPNYTGGAWYRLIWSWNCQDHARLAEPIAFSISHINTAGAIFLNGDMLWSDKSLHEPLSKSWNMPRFWIMPISGLKKNSNEILIYVTGYSAMSSGIGTVSFDNVIKANAVNDKRIWNMRTLFQINLILSATLGMFCLVIWLYRRSESSFGWFAISCFLWILFISNILATETYIFSSSVAAARMNLIIFMLYILCFCTYLLRFVRVKKPKIERFLLILTAVFILCIWTVSLNQMKGLFDSVFLFYCGIYFVTYIHLCWVAVRVKRSDYILLAVCMTAIMFISVYDLRLVFISSVPDITLLSPYTSPLFTLFIVILLGSRLDRNIKKIEHFNDELSTKIQQVSLDLSSSLNDQHRLELFNARLQERMKLSHDLHDGLGSSIVRSMILVDQCDKKIPNKQFLSMLKLLRDDLRQIIDSGSVAGNKIPETPLLWAAPVRHRFSQLMDEMDIRAQWEFAAQWETEPTALQCLNLIRVLEESLTNVIKHSQATQVKVSMHYASPSQLELIIQDNGVGFDVDCVKQNGMSIGMRSMQSRIEKMSGNFSIDSGEDGTIVHACIKL